MPRAVRRLQAVRRVLAGSGVLDGVDGCLELDLADDGRVVPGFPGFPGVPGVPG